MGVFLDSGVDAGAELGNFWKNKVQVWQDAAIKKLIFIFYIYFKGKKIFLLWESMQTTSFESMQNNIMGKHINNK